MFSHLWKHTLKWWSAAPTSASTVAMSLWRTTVRHFFLLDLHRIINLCVSMYSLQLPISTLRNSAENFGCIPSDDWWLLHVCRATSVTLSPFGQEGPQIWGLYRLPLNKAVPPNYFYHCVAHTTSSGGGVPVIYDSYMQFDEMQIALCLFPFQCVLSFCWDPLSIRACTKKDRMPLNLLPKYWWFILSVRFYNVFLFFHHLLVSSPPGSPLQCVFTPQWPSRTAAGFMAGKAPGILGR